MTLQEAKLLQRERERKIIIKFLALSIVVCSVSFLVLYFSKLLERTPIFYFVPLLFILVIAKYTGITKLMGKREIAGEVVKINIYPVKTGKIKGEHMYESSRGDGLEAEIIIKTDNGDTKLRVFPNGDTTSRLCIGDRIAFLRNIGEPIVIKGAYLK